MTFRIPGFGPPVFTTRPPKDLHMRLPDGFLHSVAFLGGDRPGVGRLYGGTGFFVQIKHDDGRGEIGLRYLVTARHNVWHPRLHGEGLHYEPAAFAEFTNMLGQRFHESLVDADWRAPDDVTVDLAVCHFPGITANLAIPPNVFVAPGDFSHNGVGVGDETYAVSLFGFRNQPMSSSPIVRVGHVAMLPSERIETAYGPTTAYLIEARSISGFSGAPVFVASNVRLADQRDAAGRATQPRAAGDLRLLGMIHGHWSIPPEAFDETLPPISRQKDAINAGIAVVVPAIQIAEFFESTTMREARSKHAADERARRRASAPLPTLD